MQFSLSQLLPQLLQSLDVSKTGYVLLQVGAVIVVHLVLELLFLCLVLFCVVANSVQLGGTVPEGAQQALYDYLLWAFLGLVLHIHLCHKWPRGLFVVG